MQQYGYSAEKLFFSPGRINIIGEHIDYNGGLVFPCAISLGTAAAVGRRQHDLEPLGGTRLGLYSHNFPELKPQTFSLSLSSLVYREQQGWCNYALGMAWALQQAGMELNCTLDIVFFGNLPAGGSGLSSSASLEILTGYVLQSYGGFALSREQLAVLAQQAENEFCGMHCGIMDQFIIAVAQPHKACLLDCATLKYQQVPLELEGELHKHSFLIANTKLPRKLQQSKYNERRAECEQALAYLTPHFDGPPTKPNVSAKLNLCNLLSEDDLPAALELLRDQETLQRRVRHVISENDRTRAAAVAMQQRNWRKLGTLLQTSHASLRDDYEVSGPHLDYLVALLEQESAVLGARMTGAGFGGCVIALIHHSRQEGGQMLKQLQHKVATAYCQKFGWQPEFYLADVVGGVAELSEITN